MRGIKLTRGGDLAEGTHTLYQRGNSMPEADLLEASSFVPPLYLTHRKKK